MKKLSKWAKENGYTYDWAYKMFKSGKLPVIAKQMENGTILVQEGIKTSCKAISVNSKRHFTVEVDIDINSSSLNESAQIEILNAMNILVEKIAEKLNYGVIKKKWVP